VVKREATEKFTQKEKDVDWKSSAGVTRVREKSTECSSKRRKAKRKCNCRNAQKEKSDSNRFKQGGRAAAVIKGRPASSPRTKCEGRVLPHLLGAAKGGKKDMRRSIKRRSASSGIAKTYRTLRGKPYSLSKKISHKREGHVVCPSNKRVLSF